MTLERFERVLRWKYDKGIHSFIGNVSGNKYRILCVTGEEDKLALFVNRDYIGNGDLSKMASLIYSIELEACL